jgi:hypothetical protein
MIEKEIPSNSMKWYWRIFPWLMFDFMKAKADSYVREQKAVAQKAFDEAEKKLVELRKGNFLVKTEHETEFCFHSGGVDYFKFINDFNIPIERSFAAMDAYAKYDERCERFYHETAYKAILECIKKVEIGKVFVICDNALEKMQHITNVDLLYELASVLYIDKNENPYQYDVAYNQKKIANWKKDGDIESFFLKTPLKDFLPSFSGLDFNIVNYTQQQRKDTIKKLTFHLSQFSQEERGSGIFLQANFLRETLQELTKLEK